MAFVTAFFTSHTAVVLGCAALAIYAVYSSTASFYDSDRGIMTTMEADCGLDPDGSYTEIGYDYQCRPNRYLHEIPRGELLQEKELFCRKPPVYCEGRSNAAIGLAMALSGDCYNSLVRNSLCLPHFNRLFRVEKPCSEVCIKE